MRDRPVFYFTRMVPGYRTAVLERLNDRLDGRLVVCSGQPVGSSSLNYLVEEAPVNYRRIQLRNYWLLGDRVHAQPFGKPFREVGNPSVVLAEESPRSVTLPLLLRHAGKHGAGRVLWGQFSSLHRPFDPSRNLQDRYRVMMARGVEACVCYTDGVAEHLQSFIPKEKLFVAPNTIDLAPVLAQRDRLAAEGKAAIRKRLGLPPSRPVLVYLGRLIPEKGTSMLLRTYMRLLRDGPGTLLVIGAGPERSAMEATAASNGLDDVHFLGPLPDDEAAPYLYASDIMLMPGYLGLVINHAFAFGLPVVSFRNPAGAAMHSPEVEYVRSGENGLLCEGDTAEELYDGVKTVLEDLSSFSANALSFAREHLTIDKMVDGLYYAVSYAGRRQG